MYKSRKMKEVLRLVEDNSFSTVEAYKFHTCFDIMAQKDGKRIIIKFEKNIDGLQKSDANALHMLETFLDSQALVIGKNYKGKKLEDGTIFKRYGIGCISESTLEYLMEGRDLNNAKRFKKNVKTIDGLALRRLRKLVDSSMHELSEAVGISKDSIYRYEKGREDITTENLSKLEDFFKSRLSYRKDSVHREKQCEFPGARLAGTQLLLFETDPFTLILKGLSIYEAGREANFRTMEKWADFYKDINKAFGDYPFFLGSNRLKKTNRNGIPVVTMKELETVGAESKLMELVLERGNYKN